MLALGVILAEVRAVLTLRLYWFLLNCACSEVDFGINSFRSPYLWVWLIVLNCSRSKVRLVVSCSIFALLLVTEVVTLEAYVYPYSSCYLEMFDRSKDLFSILCLWFLLGLLEASCIDIFIRFLFRLSKESNWFCGGSLGNWVMLTEFASDLNTAAACFTFYFHLILRLVCSTSGVAVLESKLLFLACYVVLKEF